MDDFQFTRSLDDHYRTTPLKGLFAGARGGFYHGRFATYLALIVHYDARLQLSLSDTKQNDLVEYLASW